MEVIENGIKNQDQTTMKCECKSCQSLLRVSHSDLMVRFDSVIDFNNMAFFQYTYVCPVCNKQNFLDPMELTDGVRTLANKDNREQIWIASDAVLNMYNAYMKQVNAKTGSERIEAEKEYEEARASYKSVYDQNFQERFGKGMC